MLVKPTVSQLLKSVENRYRLSVATAKRARQLYAGSKKLIKTSDTAPVSIAADEINVGFLRIYDANQWKEEQEKYYKYKEQEEALKKVLNGETNLTTDENKEEDK